MRLWKICSRRNRTQKLIGNLLLLAVVIFIAEWMLHFPTLTKGGLLRRAEQQYFLENSEILFTGDEFGPNTLYARNDELLMAVVYSKTLLGYQLNWSYLIEEPDGIYCDTSDFNHVEYMAFGLLEDIARAELEVTLDITVSDVTRLHEVYTAEGIRINPYCFRFTLEPHYRKDDGSIAATEEVKIFADQTIPRCYDAALRLYDEDGTLMHEKRIEYFDIKSLGW